MNRTRIFAAVLAIAALLTMATLTNVVSASEGIGVSPAVLDYQNVTKGSTHVQTITIYNIGSQTAKWTIKPSSSSLSATPAHGTLGPNSHVVVKIALRVPTNSALGKHTAKITVSMAYSGSNIGLSVVPEAVWNVVN